MNSCHKTWLAKAAIATSLAILSGCGGGDSGSDTVSASTVTAPAEPNPRQNVPPSAKAPDIPTGALALAGTNKLTLSWNSVSGATSYGIYWSTTPGVTAANGTRIVTADNSYIHRGLLPATGYYYIVTAVNDYGESAASGQFAATTVVADGSLAYAGYCANCHGALALSSVTNAGLSQIDGALQSVGAMSNITLTDAQVGAIAAALMNNQ